MKKRNIVIIYHAECPDGFGAAWAAWRKFGDEAVYVPAFHRTELPAIVDGSDVYTLDYCYPGEQMKNLVARAGSVTVIDHHASNEGYVSLAGHSLFDVGRSGAVLAWKYFHPDEKLPRLLEYVEDKDLWNFVLPNSKEITQALSMYKYDFSLWNKIAADMEVPKKRLKYIVDGELLQRKMMKLVDEAVENAEEVEFEGYKCLMVNSQFHTSEIGAGLVKKMPPIGIVWSRRKKKIVISLRSDGTVDVAKIAQKYGGGGHPESSGFGWEDDQLLNLKKHMV
jgi:oligoribonuclease NrnB/cAMP/cGMP phosphodiesterase (DHH superfamily)